MNPERRSDMQAARPASGVFTPNSVIRIRELLPAPGGRGHRTHSFGRFDHHKHFGVVDEQDLQQGLEQGTRNARGGIRVGAGPWQGRREPALARVGHRHAAFTGQPDRPQSGRCTGIRYRRPVQGKQPHGQFGRHGQRQQRHRGRRCQGGDRFECDCLRSQHQGDDGQCHGDWRQCGGRWQRGHGARFQRVGKRAAQSGGWLSERSDAQGYPSAASATSVRSPMWRRVPRTPMR